MDSTPQDTPEDPDAGNHRSASGAPFWNRPGSIRHRAVHLLLAALAVAVAWFPVETRLWTATLVATVVLVLVPWAWTRSPRTTVSGLAAALAVVLVAGISGLSGWDASRAVAEVALAAAIVALIWLGSRENPPEGLPTLVAVGLTGLALWGLWQVAFGYEALRPGLDGLTDAARAYAEERVASRRAFASLPLPSHLAVVLAMSLPLLVVRIRATATGAMWAAASAVAVTGLLLTKSPVGIGLALVAVLPLLVRGQRWVKAVVIVGLVAALVAVVAVRPDVTELEPVTLRIDNWSTAAWLWSGSPVTGIGLAGFAQASQANPLEVGNRPAHAHGFPMEALAELGPLGVIAAILGALWLAGLIRDLWRDHRALALAVAVVPLHNLVDFSIFVSGVALPWALLLGWAAAQRHRDHGVEPAPPGWGRTLILALAAVAWGLTLLHASSLVVETSAARMSEPADRFVGAIKAIEMAPWRIEPQFLLAAAAIAENDPEMLDRAWAVLDRQRWWRPRSAALADRRARLALARGDVSTAVAELWTAAAHGGRDSGAGDSLRRAIDDLEGRER